MTNLNLQELAQQTPARPTLDKGEEFASNQQRTEWIMNKAKQFETAKRGSNSKFKWSWGTVADFLTESAEVLNIVKIRRDNEELNRNKLYVWDFDRRIYVDDATFMNAQIIRCVHRNLKNTEIEDIKRTLLESPASEIKQLFFNSAVKYIRCETHLIELKGREYTATRNEDNTFKPVITLADYWPLSFVNTSEPVFTLDDGTSFRVSDWIKDTVANNDKELEKSFYQIIGQLLATETGGMIYLFYSKATNSGKGSALSLLQMFAGNKAVNIPLDQFDDNKALASLINVRNILADELPQHIQLSKNKTRNIKALVGGEGTSITQLYQDGLIHLPPINVMVQTSNYIPHANDSAIFGDKRMKVIPFTKQFKKGKERPEIKGRIFKEKALHDWLFSLVIQQRLFNLKRNELIDAKKSKEIKAIAIEESSIVRQWYNEEFKEKNEYCTYKKRDLFRNFKFWAPETKMKANSFYDEFLEVASKDGWQMTQGTYRAYQTETSKGNACFYNNDLKAEGYELNLDEHFLNKNRKINNEHGNY